MGEARLAIALRDVGYQTQGAVILDGLNWEVYEGQRWTVLGPNGSGKTTLLRIITGYGYPSRGSVQVLGRSFGRTDLRALRACIGWVHYDLRALIPEFMSVLEVVLSGRRGELAFYREASDRERRQASAALEQLRAGHLLQRRFATLSTGERQRVLIARALMTRPEILLLDEPCLGLDPLSREEFLQALSELFSSRERLTVITVTHHVEEIMREYDGVLILDKGRRVACGSRQETLRPELISRIFGKGCRISMNGGRYSLSFEV